jgi:hypothetical protein
MGLLRNRSQAQKKPPQWLRLQRLFRSLAKRDLQGQD